MGQLPQNERYTISEYLTLECDAHERHEYRNGQIISIGGGTPMHSLICANFIGVLSTALKGTSYNVYDCGLRIRIPRNSTYTYADASVYCRNLIYDSNDPLRHTVTNPLLLMEVLSPSTEAYDRGDKFNRYRTLETLKEYVLLSQNAPRAEVFLRQSDGTWRLSPVEGLTAHAEITSLSVKLPLAEIYRGVEFEPIAPEI